jgi:hypothetical protein
MCLRFRNLKSKCITSNAFDHKVTITATAQNNQHHTISSGLSSQHAEHNILRHRHCLHPSLDLIH